MYKEEQTSKVYNLLSKYFSNTVALIGNKYDFSILDNEYEKLKNINNSQYPRETNIIDFVIYCEENNIFHKELASFLDGLVKEVVDILGVKFEKKLRNSFKGKFTNLSSLNYLNPFGEVISLLTILKNKNNKLLEIEHKLSNKKSVDFIFSNKDNEKIGVEVRNIHPKELYKNISELKQDLLGKLCNKISSESENIQFDSLNFTWTYLPVLWSTNLKGLLPYKDFFQRFGDSPIKIIGKEIYVFGFTSFVQYIYNNTNKRGFKYGYVTELLNKISI